MKSGLSNNLKWTLNSSIKTILLPWPLSTCWNSSITKVAANAKEKFKKTDASNVDQMCRKKLMST